MNALSLRTRVAVLWVAVAVAASASMFLYVFMPGALEELLGGAMEGEALSDGMTFFMASLVIIPVVMAVVTLVLGHRVNCYTNLVAGLAFGLFGVFAVIEHVNGGGFNVHVLMVAVAGALSLLIAGLGFVGLRQPKSEVAAGAAEQIRPREEVSV